MATGSDIVSEASKYLGDAYVYGAEGPNTFDCSGLVQYVFAKVGIHLPRTSEEQFKVGTAIQQSQLQPGDLVFSAGSDGTADAPGHVGIYAGRHDFGGSTGSVPAVLEAPHTGDVVKYLPLSQFSATGYRHMTGLATDPFGDSWPGATSAAQSLIQWPGDMIKFFSTATDDLTSMGQFFGAFLLPSTWVRIGAGAVGSLCLLAGLIFLVVESAK